MNATTRNRLEAKERYDEILGKAVSFSEESGYLKLTRQNISELTGVSVGLISHYFKSAEGLQDAVVQYAIDKKIYKIIGQAVANRHRMAQRLTQKTIDRALKELGAAG